MKKCFGWLSIATALLVPAGPVTIVCGQDETKPAQAATETTDQELEQEESGPTVGLKRYSALNDQFETVQRAFFAQSREISEKLQDANDDEREAIMQEVMAAQKQLMEEAAGIGNQMLELAAAEGTGKPVAFNSIQWVLENTQNADVRRSAVALLLRDHLDNEGLEPLLSALMRGMPSQATEDLFVQLSENGGNERIRAIATLSLASYLARYRNMVGDVIEDEDFARQYADSIDYFRKLAAVDDARIEGILNRAATEFATVEYNDSTVGEAAAKELKKFLIAKNLKVGKVAPDIEGPDIDGTVFRLSDYRGKVVMLDFWGDW
jgi:hypothetical protein